jgi:hypothetical protein
MKRKQRGICDLLKTIQVKKNRTEEMRTHLIQILHRCLTPREEAIIHAMIYGGIEQMVLWKKPAKKKKRLK